MATSRLLRRSRSTTSYKENIFKLVWSALIGRSIFSSQSECSRTVFKELSLKIVQPTLVWCTLIGQKILNIQSESSKTAEHNFKREIFFMGSTLPFAFQLLPFFDTFCGSVLTRKASSVTRYGDLFDFGQLFKAFGNNYFVLISHILRQFL